ncbi:hypothetical protein CPB84DRAFT_1750928 [Gymnopilus junonius]|uniref:Uncharacterized protein n=1 Tax=Gymnopilus junonius TaxID=109634 RepID=A0A9P5NEQ1_GYMJU|nr:hypothetical protein CPB84DRAFT_1750928 [Gymnopilus junonius]
MAGVTSCAELQNGEMSFLTFSSTKSSRSRYSGTAMRYGLKHATSTVSSIECPAVLFWFFLVPPAVLSEVVIIIETPKWLRRRLRRTQFKCRHATIRLNIDFCTSYTWSADREDPKNEYWRIDSNAKTKKCWLLNSRGMRPGPRRRCGFCIRFKLKAIGIERMENGRIEEQFVARPQLQLYHMGR